MGFTQPFWKSLKIEFHSVGWISATLDLADDDDDATAPVAAANGDLDGVQSRSRTSVLLCVVKLNSLGAAAYAEAREVKIIGVCILSTVEYGLMEQKLTTLPWISKKIIMFL